MGSSQGASFPKFSQFHRLTSLHSSNGNNVPLMYTKGCCKYCTQNKGSYCIITPFCSVLYHLRGIPGGFDERLGRGEQLTSFLTPPPKERGGSTAPKAVVLTCAINGALTRWQVFEHITACTLPLHY